MIEQGDKVEVDLSKVRDSVTNFHDLRGMKEARAIAPLERNAQRPEAMWRIRLIEENVGLKVKRKALKQ